MMFQRRLLACSVLIVCAASTIAVAQNDEREKLLARRAAEADAYRKIAETIKGIQINSETYVRDFVTESDVIESGLDELIKGVRLGRPTYFDDGMCQVDAEVTVAKVVERLKELHTRHYVGGRVVGTDFSSIEKRMTKRIIKVTGSGAPRVELPPELPQGVLSALPPPVGVQSRSSFPSIWQSVSPQGRLMAAQAARRDAQRKLLERINGVRINSQTLVREFVTENDTIRTKAQGLVIGAEEVNRYYHDDELIVEVTMAVPTEQVLRTIKELHTRHYQGDRVTGTDIEKISERIKRKTFEATGSGVPGERYRRAVTSNPSVVTPDWLERRITVTGQGTDPQIDTPQGKLKAIRAAIADARRKLIEQVHGLELSSATYVRDFVTQRDEIRTQLQSVIAGSVIERQDVDDQFATVTVSIGGPDVWRVIHAQQAIETRR
ncbi:MAG: hypothetical protein V3W34_11510 [Phycisphaerae bacterium]